MPRVARIVVPDVPHHVTQRGNYRQRIFFRDEDRRLYLDLLGEFAPHYGVSLLGYCLMPNHVHLIATPHNERSLGRTLQRVHADYARSVHLRLGRTGHLWQARFHSVALDEEHFWAAMVYVEQNPVRAGLVKHGWEYRWSSAPLRLAERPENRYARLLDVVKWRGEHTAETWKRCLDYGLQDGMLIERIREGTLKGWPLGDDEFAKALKERLGFHPQPRKRGPKAADREAGGEVVRKAAG